MAPDFRWEKIFIRVFLVTKIYPYDLHSIVCRSSWNDKNFTRKKDFDES